MRINRKISEDMGVSESIGFIIIFSIVMIGIGLITLYGYPLLLKQQSATNVRNMERDMIILQNDIKSLAYKNIPYKETSLQVAGGSLSVYGFNINGYEAKFNVTVINKTDPLDGTYYDQPYLSYEGKIGQLRYESDSLDDVIILENGAILRRQRLSTGSVMLAEPRWYIDKANGNEILVINLINISSEMIRSRTGVGTVKMTLVGVDYNETPAGAWRAEIRYIKDSEYDFSAAWQDYLARVLGFNEASGRWYREGLYQVVIKRYEIAVENL